MCEMLVSLYLLPTINQLFMAGISLNGKGRALWRWARYVVLPYENESRNKQYQLCSAFSSTEIYDLFCYSAGEIIIKLYNIGWCGTCSPVFSQISIRWPAIDLVFFVWFLYFLCHINRKLLTVASISQHNRKIFMEINWNVCLQNWNRMA